ncbi:hypothetical protein SAMN02745121_06285 [Nannocystis exedens]|uniref:Adhesin domain-containing protein n=1 Tax=Nannocystis exedens TaxID=54 RepID=A0A1I2EXG0_9BACT|nr:hypothetical protein [Nannocystis exedens]PCC69477.1 hypothetical protein NAEX_02499 [Nannocystis exedens]SFE97118.1 hypothetical protein SAMN02745121_06285 [Nannocystis exedens]
MSARRSFGLALALPLLLGLGFKPGTCGSILDYNEIDIVLEPVARLHVTNERGTVKTITFARNGVRIWEHVFGFQISLGRQEHWVEDDTLFAHFDCREETECLDDMNFELPLGTAIELDVTDVDVDIGAPDADVTVAVEIGEVLIHEITGPNTTVEVGEGGATLTFAAAPTSVVVTVDDGAVDLDLPAGPYRCDFTVEDGEQTLDGITCDDGAAATLTVSIAHGDLTVHAS